MGSSTSPNSNADECAPRLITLNLQPPGERHPVVTPSASLENRALRIERSPSAGVRLTRYPSKERLTYRQGPVAAFTAEERTRYEMSPLRRAAGSAVCGS